MKINLAPFEVTEKCTFEVSGADKITTDDILNHLNKMYPDWSIRPEDVNIEVTAGIAMIVFTRRSGKAIEIENKIQARENSYPVFD